MNLYDIWYHISQFLVFWFRFNNWSKMFSMVPLFRFDSVLTISLPVRPSMRLHTGAVSIVPADGLAGARPSAGTMLAAKFDMICQGYQLFEHIQHGRRDLARYHGSTRVNERSGIYITVTLMKTYRWWGLVYETNGHSRWGVSFLCSNNDTNLSCVCWVLVFLLTCRTKNNVKRCFYQWMGR